MEEDRKDQVYLVGCVHTDPDGGKRLRYILECVRPKVIALEMNSVRMEDIKQDMVEEEFVHLSLVLSTIERKGITLSESQKEVIMEIERMHFRGQCYELFESERYLEENSDVRLELIDLPLYTNVEEKAKVKKGGKDYTVWDLERALNALSPEEIDSYGADFDDREKAIDSKMAQFRRGAYFDYHCNNGGKLEMSDEALKMQGHSDNAIYFLRKIFNPERDIEMERRIREISKEGERIVAIGGLYHLHLICKRITDLSPKLYRLDEADRFCRENGELRCF